METITKHEIFIRHNLNSILNDFVQCVLMEDLIASKILNFFLKNSWRKTFLIIYQSTKSSLT